MAHEITNIDYSIFRQLKLIEFLYQAWSKPSTQYRCPTIMKMVNRFNAMSSWVAFLILEPTRLANRIQRFEKLIRIAAELESLGNYHALMAFLSGMNNSSISRLSLTKNALHKRELQKLQELEALMNMESSYARYRKALLVAEPPIIPYLGVYLGDLTFVGDGNPDFIDELINFSKYRLFCDTIGKIPDYQMLNVQLETISHPDLHPALAILPLFPDQFLYNLSLQREPRGVRN